MGCWDSYCCFCSGPFADARRQWLQFLTADIPDGKWPPGDGEWHNRPGYPVPSQPLDEIVTISERDGEFWNRAVSVTPRFPETFVTTSCTVGSYGDVSILGTGDELQIGGDRFLLIHPACLSFLCRHATISPRELWESFYGDKSCYKLFGGAMNGLLYCVDYYYMRQRSGQSFDHAVTLDGPPSNRPDLEPAKWSDPDTMRDAKWLLARPTILPTPKRLQKSTITASAMKYRKVFDTPELFDIILSSIVDIPQNVIKSELQKNNESRGCNGHCSCQGVFEAPSAIVAAKTLLSLAQADRWFYDEIIHKRQDFFLRALRNFGWMLPFTPADWSDNSWASDILTNTSSSQQADVDWRQYMLTCVKKDLPHVRNRWRFHTMAVQFERGTSRYGTKEHPNWSWNAGNLGFIPSLNKPDPDVWELDEVC